MVPLVVPLFGLARLLRNKKGEAPGWVQWLTGKTFKTTWAIHDYLFKPLFGSGEVREPKN